MMKYQLKTLEGCTQLFEIKAEEKELKETEEKVFQDFERVARIPGFRVGKAPRDLVRKQYGKEAREEVLKRMIPELYEQALEASHLPVIGLPEITDVQFESTKLSFKAKVETKPKVTLKKYKGLKVSRKVASVTPGEVQEQLQRLQEERAELVPKEGAVEETDFVMCDVEGRIDGKVTESKKNVLISTSLKDLKHPEIAQALLGAKPGDAREAEVTLESPGGVVQKVRYALQVHEVKKKNLPAMNDEFVQSISRFKTQKELEEAISKEIQSRKERENKQALERGLLDQLKDSCTFPIPNTLRDQEAKQLMEDQAFRWKLLGWPDPEIQKRITENKNTFLKEAEDRVRHSLILEEIAKVENVTVSPEEVEERIRQYSERLRRSDKEKEDDLKNPSLKRRIATEILFEKALTVVVEAADIKDVS